MEQKNASVVFVFLIPAALCLAGPAAPVSPDSAIRAAGAPVSPDSAIRAASAPVSPDSAVRAAGPVSLTADDPEWLELERYLETEAESQDPTLLLDYLDRLRHCPIDLNRASAAELQTLPWISPGLAAAIVRFRNESGFYGSSRDLMAVQGMDGERLAMLEPFIRIGSGWRMPQVSIQGRHRLQRDIEEARGYRDDVYPGGPEKLYQRLRGTVGERFSFAVVLEKDAGEKRIDDLMVGYGCYSTADGRTRITAGDMVLEAGQGLVFWSPYRIQKGYDAVAPGKQRSRGLRPFSSVSENSAFRGVGVSAELGPWQVDALLSRTLRDATIRDDSVSTLLTSGYHRTPSEIDRRDNLTEQLGGLNVSWSPRPAARFGFGVQRSGYDTPIRAGDDYYGFSGSSNTVIGGHYDVAFRDLDLFGEIARSESGGLAMISGCWIERDVVDLVFSWRHYQEDFHNFHGSAFSETGSLNNERGLYLGLAWKMSRQTRLSFYFDRFKHPWIRARVPLPSSGWETLVMAEHRFSSRAKGLVRARMKVKERAMNAETAAGLPYRRLTQERKFNLRLQADVKLRRSLQWRARLEGNWVRYGGSSSAAVTDSLGTMIYSDLVWKPPRFFSLRGRLTWFDAPAYDFRLYQVEPDLPGVLRLKMLYGQGWRWTVILGLWHSKKLRLFAKGERTLYRDRDGIGSGYERIEGSSESALSLQLDWRL